MADERPRGFRARPFAASGVVLTVLGLPITGLALHAADGAGMTPERHAWMTAHNTLGVLFIVFAVWHTCLNWRALLRHLGGAVRGIPLPSRETVTAFVLVGGLLALAVGHALVVPERGHGRNHARSHAVSSP